MRITRFMNFELFEVFESCIFKLNLLSLVRAPSRPLKVLPLALGPYEFNQRSTQVCSNCHI